MPLAHEICDGTVLHCIDFRFREFLQDFLHKRFPESNYDLISVAGGVKELIADNEKSSDFLLKQFNISVGLHNPSTFVLIQHEDCGAYGGSDALGESWEELEFQKKELLESAAFLKKHYPKTAVEMYFIDLSGKVTLVESE
ncbi:hypothetical protein IIB49_00925 [Patescibacteria group bacterium]|nr:hypothetical protein [Patescibacteria group bacterium]